MYAGDQKILGRKKNDKLPPPNVFAKKLFEELDKNGDGIFYFLLKKNLITTFLIN